MKTFAFIFARGGSKGLPKKNIKDLCGLPLIAHTINLAKSTDFIDNVIVSTDNQEIAEISKHYGATVPFMRPAELAEDDAPEFLAWKHAVEWTFNNIGHFNTFISLPPTAPLRSANDIKRCIDSLTENTDMVVSCKHAERSPFFNMVKKTQQDYVELVNNDSMLYSRRQDVPQIFDVTTVAYVCKPTFILENNSIWDGKTKAVLIPKERAIDIDDQWDFLHAEMLMRYLNASG